ncbi:MAG TPA: PaaX family transcriptional regulator C-terminal domain-containing protein [Bacillota bacterium]|nr:PaaX family transcriptional regulator C-terminal domain-containing protein [Bacillota bacterium]
MLSIEKQILFLISRFPQVAIKDLVAIYKGRNYSEQYIRNCISKLKQEGYIVSSSRSLYTITENGCSLLNSVNAKPLKYFETWNGQWYLVLVEIPETRRKIRDTFRTSLFQLGFGRLYQSVFISPWNYQEEVSRLIKKHQIIERVSVFYGSMLTNFITPKQAEIIWELPQLRTLYHEKEKWYRHTFLPNIKTLEQEKEGLKWLIEYLHLGEELSDLCLKDPMLPKELLPSDWPGKGLLTEIADQFWDMSQSTRVNLTICSSNTFPAFDQTGQSQHYSRSVRV